MTAKCLDRRTFLGGLVAAPAVIRTPGLLMPVKLWIEPFLDEPFVYHGPWHYVTGFFLDPKTNAWKYYERMAVEKLVDL